MRAVVGTSLGFQSTLDRDAPDEFVAGADAVFLGADEAGGGEGGARGERATDEKRGLHGMASFHCLTKTARARMRGSALARVTRRRTAERVRGANETIRLWPMFVPLARGSHPPSVRPSSS